MQDIILAIAIAALFIGAPLLTGKLLAWSMQGEE